MRSKKARKGDLVGSELNTVTVKKPTSRRFKTTVLIGGAVAMLGGVMWVYGFIAANTHQGSLFTNYGKFEQFCISFGFLIFAAGIITFGVGKVGLWWKQN